MDKMLDDRIAEILTLWKSTNNKFNATIEEQYARVDSERCLKEKSFTMAVLIRDMQQALEQQKEREGKLVVAIRKELDLAIEYRTRLDFLKERTPFQEGYITALRFTEATLKELGIL